MREVSGNSHSQDDSRPNFGLGDATKADRVITEWPSGNKQEYVDLTADRVFAITELNQTPPPRPSAGPGGAVTRAGLTAGSCP